MYSSSREHRLIASGGVRGLNTWRRGGEKTFIKFLHLHLHTHSGLLTFTFFLYKMALILHDIFYFIFYTKFPIRHSVNSQWTVLLHWKMCFPNVYMTIKALNIWILNEVICKRLQLHTKSTRWQSGTHTKNRRFLQPFFLEVRALK